MQLPQLGQLLQELIWKLLGKLLQELLEKLLEKLLDAGASQRHATCSTRPSSLEVMHEQNGIQAGSEAT